MKMTEVRCPSGHLVMLVSPRTLIAMPGCPICRRASDEASKPAAEARQYYKHLCGCVTLEPNHVHEEPK